MQGDTRFSPQQKSLRESHQPRKTFSMINWFCIGSLPGFTVSLTVI